MTINELKHYRVLKSRLQRKEDKLGSMLVHVKDTVTGCTPPSYTAHNISIEGKAYEASSVTELADIARLKRQIAKIETFVQSISDVKIKEAIEQFYLEPTYGEKVTWNAVADKMDEPSGDALRMSVKRFLACSECSASSF